MNDDKYGSSKTNNIWGPSSEGKIYLTDLLTQSACDFIDKNSDAPFFFIFLTMPLTVHCKESFPQRLKHIESEALKLYASMLLSVDEGYRANFR